MVEKQVTEPYVPEGWSEPRWLAECKRRYEGMDPNSMFDKPRQFWKEMVEAMERRCKESSTPQKKAT